MTEGRLAGPYLIGASAPSAGPPATSDLVAQADAALGVTPVSVVQKGKDPPSGDKHDWMNLADYSWPNPNTADGLPYVTRDGEANPEASLYDRRRLNLLVVSVLRLGAAWRLTRTAKYADKAVELMRHWFIKPETAMSPHLRFAHHVPGDVPGRKDGLIVFCSALPSLLDIWLTLHQSGVIEPEANATIEAWSESFLHWLLTDPMSIAHAQAENNHGSYHDYLLAYLMLFVGRRREAADKLSEALSRRLSAQIRVSGEQPRETSRTLSAQYSMYNLKALMSMARLGDALGVDGWHRSRPQPEILQATRFLYKHATGDVDWPYLQIEPPNWWFLVPLCAVANTAYGSSLDVARIIMNVPAGAVPVEPVVFAPGCELLFAPSHQQHLPFTLDEPNNPMRAAADGRT